MTIQPLPMTDYESHALSAAYFSLEACAMLLMNTIFVIVLYKCRQKINWKIFVFILNVSISDIISACMLISMAVSMFYYIHSVASFIEIGVQLACSYSILITIFNYNSLLFFQYLAVKHPIFYQTRCTRSFFMKILFVQYAVILAFETWKGYVLTNERYEIWFSYVEVFIMALSLIVNVWLYSYVLYVVGKRKRSIVKVKFGERTVSSQNLRNISTSTSKMEYLKNFWVCLTQDYWGITTAGFQLMIYILTFMPLLIVRISIMALGSQDGQRDVYRCHTAACHFSLMIWFARGIVDPLIHIIRDRKLQILNRQDKKLSAIDGPFCTGVRSKKSTCIVTVSGTLAE